MRPEAARDGRAAAAASRFLTMPGVVDVRYDEAWLARLSGGVNAIRGPGLAIGAVLFAAAALAVASVVRLGLQARRAEVDVMLLAAAPLAYIRGPFIAQGAIQGGAGALAALLLLWLGYAEALSRWGEPLSGMLDGVGVVFLSPAVSALLVAVGMAVGAIGGPLALRHSV